VLHDFWSGRIREADAGRATIELRRVESASRQMADGTHLVWQTIAHAYCDDLTHVKQIIDELRHFAQRHPGWLSVVDYATGEYHRIRGDFASAAEHLNAVLEATRAGTHQIWVHAAGAYISVLCSLGRVQDAVSLGEAYLQSAEQAELGYTSNYIRMPLAIALARSGLAERATLEAESVIERFDALGTTGVNLVLAYEARSRVALHLDNSADYERFSQLCAEHCRAAGGRALRAKYDRLAGAARASALVRPGAPDAALSTSLLDTRIKAVFTECSEPRLRADRSLQLLLSESGSSEGALFLLGDDGPHLAARIGESSDELQLAVAVQEFLDEEFAQRGGLTMSLATACKSSVATTKIQQYVFILLSHQSSEGFGISGVAALQIRRGVSYAQPGALAAGLSRMLSEHGDAVTRLVE
jgi:hypothetical protein